MGFLDSLKSMFVGSGGGADEYWIYVRCRRCGEAIGTRIDLRNSLSMRDEGGFVVNKTLMGTGENHCFQRIEVTLTFDESRRLVDRQIGHGEFISAEDFQAAQAELDSNG